MEAKFQMESLWVGGIKVCSNGTGHVTKIAAMHLYGKNSLKVFFFETNRPMTFKLSIQRWGFEPYDVCSNDEPELALTTNYGNVRITSQCFCMENVLTLTIEVYEE